jgi:hypothetical protein
VIFILAIFAFIRSNESAIFDDMCENFAKDYHLASSFGVCKTRQTGIRWMLEIVQVVVRHDMGEVEGFKRDAFEQ